MADSSDNRKIHKGGTSIISSEDSFQAPKPKFIPSKDPLAILTVPKKKETPSPFSVKQLLQRLVK